MWIYDKLSDRFFCNIPDNILFIDYLYEYEANDSVLSNGKHILPNDIENKFANLEGEWSVLLESLIKRLTVQHNSSALIINDSELSKLRAFINNLIIRNPNMMKLFLTDDNFNSLINKNPNLELYDSIFEELKLGSPEGFYKAVFKRTYFDEKNGLSFLKYIKNMSFVFLKPEKGCFITSDIPIGMSIDIDKEEIETLYFPICPNFAIIFFNEKTVDRNRIRVIEEKQVKELNRNMFINKECRFVIANNKRILENMII